MTTPGPRPPRSSRHGAREAGGSAAHASAPRACWSLDLTDEPTLPPLPAQRDWQQPGSPGWGNTVLLVVLGVIGAALLGLIVATEAGLLN